MNSEEAKDILQLCRANHPEDLQDPMLAEALEQMKHDPFLSAWFEEQQELDEKISAELNLIVPPFGLKASILKSMQERAKFAQTKVAGSSVAWFRPWIGGIAALFLFASILLFVLRNSPKPDLPNQSPYFGKSGESYIENTAGVPNIIPFLARKIAEFNSSQFDKRGNDFNELSSYLATAEMPNPAKIPQKLKSVPTIGCVIFDYEGTNISMICFKEEKVYHLITINQSNISSKQLAGYDFVENKIYECQKQAFKIWSEGNQVYILSTKGTKKDIPEFI